jgi:hypothetical protein
VPPVPDELVEVVQRNTAAPAEAGDLVGKPGGVEAAAQVVQVSLGDVDAEWSDGVVVIAHEDNASPYRGQILS